MGNAERFVHEHNRISNLRDPISRMIRYHDPDGFWAPADRYWNRLSEDERNYVRANNRLAEQYLPPRVNNGGTTIAPQFDTSVFDGIIRRH